MRSSVFEMSMRGLVLWLYIEERTVYSEYPVFWDRVYDNIPVSIMPGIRLYPCCNLHMGHEHNSRTYSLGYSFYQQLYTIFSQSYFILIVLKHFLLIYSRIL